MRLLFLLSLFAAPMLAHAASPLPGQAHLDCRQDSDCTAIESACRSSWLPVSTAHEAEKRAKIEQNRQRIKCKWPPQTPPKPDVACLSNQCTFKE